jgi:hypothetical protein
MVLLKSSKDRWNAANYTQIKASVNPEIAAAFKAACAANERSIASVLSGFMVEYSQTSVRALPASNPYDTKRKRRKALKAIISQMELLMEAEEAYKENIPENLQNSKWYEAAEQSLMLMEETIDTMGDIY